MLSFDQIKELIELVGKHEMSGLKLEGEDFRLRIDGATALPAAPPAAAPAVVATAPVAAAAPAAAPTAEAAPAPAASEPDAGGHQLTSPIVGTFYPRPSPDQKPFAEVGSRVTKGQVVCIVEAMKLMNEIEADVDGTVTEVYPKEGQPVEYGEPLFAIAVD